MNSTVLSHNVVTSNFKGDIFGSVETIGENPAPKSLVLPRYRLNDQVPPLSLSIKYLVVLRISFRRLASVSVCSKGKLSCNKSSTSIVSGFVTDDDLTKIEKANDLI